MMMKLFFNKNFTKFSQYVNTYINTHKKTAVSGLGPELT